MNVAGRSDDLFLGVNNFNMPHIKKFSEKGKRKWSPGREPHEIRRADITVYWLSDLEPVT